MTWALALTALAAFGSLLFDALSTYWHHRERREHSADMQRLAADEKRLDDDEQWMRRHEPE